MVDLINRGEDDPEAAVDSLGIRREKRKRVQEVQVPLPSHKRAHIYQPSSRVDIIALEKFFKVSSLKKPRLEVQTGVGIRIILRLG